MSYLSCNDKGQVLPGVYHFHDKSWLEEVLEPLGINLRSSVCKKYTDVFLDQYWVSSDLAPEGVARFEANTRLRLYVGRWLEASKGAVKKVGPVP